MQEDLLDLLVCPSCNGGLDYLKKEQQLRCRKCRASYPVRDGVPVLFPKK